MMVSFIPTQMGVSFNGEEPSALNYVRLECAPEVKFDAGDSYWGHINEVFVTDGEMTVFSEIADVEMTPGSVLVVSAGLEIST